MAEPSEADKLIAREAVDGYAGLPRPVPVEGVEYDACELHANFTASLAEAREEGRRAYRAEIVAALDCHPAYVLQEIARLREVASESIGTDDMRQREQRAREEGRREERRACWGVARQFAGTIGMLISEAIAARGPMGEP